MSSSPNILQRQRRVLYLALLILGLLLSLPVYGIYHITQSRLGEPAASYMLAVTIGIILSIVFTVAAIQQVLEGQARILKDPPAPGTRIEPYVVRFWGHKVYQYPEDPFIFEVPDAKPAGAEVMQLPLFDGRRGKTSKFTYAQKRSAVLKWERRDPSISAITLEEFLRQEFGVTEDGILQVAPSTFYDWRARIRKDLQKENKS